MAYTKQVWKDLPNETTPLSAERLNHMETQYEEAVKLFQALPEVSVRDFGAVGDGVSDDSAAFQAALAELRASGGGTLHLEGGKTYWCSRHLELIDNLRVEGNGSWMIRRYGTSEQGYAVWRTRRGAGTGYGAGCRNVIVNNIKFKGSFRPGAERMICGFALHHAEDVFLNNLHFEEGINTAHYIDMQGCRRVRVTNITLKGVLVAAGNYARTEAIQIGGSNSGGESAPDPVEDFDGLPCHNIYVSDVVSLPLTTSYGSFPAPNPFGSHDTVRTKGEDFNIWAERITVEDPVHDTTSNIPGVLKFTCVDGLTIRDVSVTSSTPADIRVVGLYDQAGGALGRVSIHNLRVSGVAAVGTKHLIYVGPGAAAGNYDRTEIDISSVRGGVGGGGSALNFLHMAGGARLTVNDFHISGPSRGMHLAGVKNVNISDVLLDSPRGDSIFISGSEVVNVSGVTINTNANPLFIDATDKATVTGCALTTSGGARTYGFRNCKAVVCVGNIADRGSTSNLGINVYNSPAGHQGVVSGNVILGGGTAVQVDSGVVVSGNSPA